MTEFESVYMSRVARLPCVMTGRRPVEVHHCGTKSGGGRHPLLAIPLHQDRKGGVHRRPDGGGISYTDAEEAMLLLECWNQMSAIYGPEYVEDVRARLLDDPKIRKRLTHHGGLQLKAVLE